MAVELNHMIISSRDGAAGATWLADLFGLGRPERYGPFWQVTTATGVNLDFHDGDGGPAARSGWPWSRIRD